MIANGQTVDIPFLVAPTNNKLNAAMWWSEPPTNNDLGLSLIGPSGTVPASSSSAPACSSAVSVYGLIASGTWTMRIRGHSVPNGPQKVYFARHERRKQF